MNTLPIVCHCMAPHANVFNVHHHGNRLYQQWLVNQICKIEMAWMMWAWLNQQQFCHQIYKGLVDYVQSGQLSSSGTPYILPATITGTPQYMHKKCQDALSLCARFGKPHMFIMFTTNPDWPEIKQQSKPHQTIHNWPDITNRVFKKKLDFLIEQLDLDSSCL